jgi:hypothetical protein
MQFFANRRNEITRQWQRGRRVANKIFANGDVMQDSKIQILGEPEGARPISQVNFAQIRAPGIMAFQGQLFCSNRDSCFSDSPEQDPQIPGNS